ncbi:hypothetical protein EMK97_18925 [Litorilituus sediminis]|uniref:Phage shock protein B n=2 Tax=Litorilituus sediminis TaxID=718192 RepID=A0A4P6P7T3_9GAMM|nr:hypothetical protein [Litorilituus sediminis]QBG37653.1 hypothetical protein EMK97_18925 [Litorilituus sediminis]
MSNGVMVIVLVSVIFGVLYEMYKKHLQFKAKTLKYNQQNDEQSNELKQQVAQLTERVQVLEKIVTDEGYQVQKDINNL